MSWIAAHQFPSRQVFKPTALASAVAIVVAAASNPAYAQTVAPAPHPDEQNLPITIQAEDISGRPDRQLDRFGGQRFGLLRGNHFNELA